MEDGELSFAQIEARIRAMPEGPASILNTPRWMEYLAAVGWLGVTIGLMPIILIQFVEPRPWMLWVARTGLFMTAGFLPSFVRNVVVTASEFWRFREKLVAQSDHDVEQFRILRAWLRTHPLDEIEEHHRFARLAADRLSAKLRFVQGGFDKLGILPALAALIYLLYQVPELTLENLLAIPRWVSFLALFFVVTYLIGMLAMLMRLRLELYEAVLGDALRERASEEARRD